MGGRKLRLSISRALGGGREAGKGALLRLARARLWGASAVGGWAASEARGTWKTTLSICVSVALAVVWMTPLLLTR